MLLSEIDLLGVSSFGLGAIGTALGALNYWRVTDRDRVKLRVTPYTGFGVGGAESIELLGVSVLNLSTFPVTVSSCGFIVPEVEADNRVAHVFPERFMGIGKLLPHRIESREAADFVMVANHNTIDPSHTYAGVWAKTACDVREENRLPRLNSSFQQLGQRLQQEQS